MFRVINFSCLIEFCFPDVNQFDMRLNQVKRVDGEAIQMRIVERISIQRNNFSQVDNRAFICE